MDIEERVRRKRGGKWLWIGALLLASSNVWAQENYSVYQTGRAQGPMSLRDSRPYNLLFLQFSPEMADTLPPKTDLLGLRLDFINNLLDPSPSYGATVLEDNETQRLQFSWRRGLDRRTEFGLFVPLLWRDAGVLDKFIGAWHRLFGVPPNWDDPGGRDSHPTYKSILSVVDAQGHVLVDQGNAFGLGDISLTWKRLLQPATPRSALAARVGLKLPTGNPVVLLGSGGFDLGVSLDLRYSVGRDLSFHLNAGGIALGSAGRVPNPQPAIFHALACMEFHPNSRDSYIAQVDANSAPVRTGNQFADRAQVTATFAYKRRMSRRQTLFASLSENGDIHDYNLPGFSNIGPDFTFSVGVEWRP